MKNKKILVTGSSGFLGSHVVDVLDEKGYEVVLFDLESSTYKKESHNEIIGDILNYDEVLSAVKGCDAIFHFAAQADIDISTTNPLKTIEQNIIGTSNILEASTKVGINRFIFASTIYVYSNLGSFYKASKQSCEKIIEEYRRQFDLDYTILRFGSLYGPRANKFNAIESFLIAALKKQKIVRKGDGEEIREYIHARDAAELSVKALSDDYKNKHLILTGNEQIKVKDLLKMINEILGGEILIEYVQDYDPSHYEITPYNYRPETAMKLTSNKHHDLGQGIIDQVYEIEKKYKDR
ncbi:MAG: NAD-dependent epimerase [Candidatus Marinimicrobia bacterium]|nr:NAD-dependent epimerase [Candidatus Neomarinimicrobiota bacterium]|tara:strand:+ start:6704 stop:7588 length:885 start_codon:yes stop_codon:yes gene_type:complete